MFEEDEVKPPPGYTLDAAPVNLPPGGYTLDLDEATRRGAEEMMRAAGVSGQVPPVYMARPMITPEQTEEANKLLKLQGARQMDRPVDVPLFNKGGPIRPLASPPDTAETPWYIRKPLEYLEGGMTQTGQGLFGLRHPKSVDQMAESASDVIRGGLTTATPFFAPEMIARPLATAVGLGTFGAAQGGAEYTAEKLGIPPGMRRLLGDLVGIYGGAKVHSWLSGLTKVPEMREGERIFQQLEGAMERLKDPTLSPGDRAALSAQTESLLQGLKQNEGFQIPALFPNPNLRERQAYNYMRQEVGVPPSAAAATGSTFVRGAQAITGTNPYGAYLDAKARGATIESLQSHGTKLVRGAMPEEGPPGDYYADLEQQVRASRPVEVPIGVDADGSIRTDEIRMPVDIRDLKIDLQPIYEKWLFRPFSERSTSAGFAATEKILKSPDHIPLDTAEAGLSEMKKEAMSNTGAPLAKYIVPKLQALIDGAAEQYGGDETLTTLRTARRTAAQQAGADWLSGQFARAQEAGGFDHGKVLFNNWVKLNDAAKRTMFSREQIADLDKFFLGLKMLSENPNPSGTAIVASIGAQLSAGGGAALVSPATALPFVLGQLGVGRIAKLLRTDAGIKLLTEGMTVPARSPKGAFLERKIRKLLENPPGGGQQPPEGGGGTPGGGTTPGGQPPASGTGGAIPASQISSVLAGAGQGMTDSLYRQLFAKLQAGDLTELGKPSRVLQEAAPEYAAGRIKSPEDLRQFVNSRGQPPAGAPPQPGGQAAGGQPPSLMQRIWESLKSDVGRHARP